VRADTSMYHLMPMAKKENHVRDAALPFGALSLPTDLRITVRNVRNVKKCLD